MKKILLFVLLMLPVAAFCQSVSVYFEIIPESHLLQIESNRRKDLIDMKKAGQKAMVPNRLGGNSELTDLTDDYLKIQTSENATFEMKLYSLKNDEQVIAVINTVCAPVCDSEISFYTTTWQPLPLEKFIDMPKVEDFAKADVDKTSDAFIQTIHSVDMTLVKLTFSSSSEKGLIASQSFADYMPDDIAKTLPNYLNDTLFIPFKK